jgi:hypothetical protein
MYGFPLVTMLREIFRPNNMKLAVLSMILHKTELVDLYWLPSIVRVMKLKRTLWAKYAAQFRKTANDWPT